MKEWVGVRRRRQGGRVGTAGEAIHVLHELAVRPLAARPLEGGSEQSGGGVWGNWVVCRYTVCRCAWERDAV